MFIGLNPSTADETKDDPTIRRCRNFAKAWGYDALCMTNLFGYRATDPNEMKDQIGPLGKDNLPTIERLAKEAGVVIAAWGVHGTHLDQDKVVRALLTDLQCLGKTKDGHPRHPLYLPKSATPIPLNAKDMPSAGGESPTTKNN